MKKAFLFPGQGAQYVGMGKDFYDAFPIAKATFQEADDLLKMHLTEIIFQGPEATLTETQHAQLAIFVVSMAILRTVEEQLGLKPDVCAGLSLGEYTALTASKRAPFATTLRLVRERGRLMNLACETTNGTMAAVLGLNEVDLTMLNNVWAANYNAPGQIVISGTKEGIEQAAIKLKEQGAKRVLPLTVHGAFHSPLMQSAQDGLTPYLEQIALQASPIRFVMNVPGDFAKEDDIRKNLIAQVTKPVRWSQSIEAMKQAGIEQFIEIGCGKTLTGLNKKIGVPSMFSIEKVADLETMHAIT